MFDRTFSILTRKIRITRSGRPSGHLRSRCQLSLMRYDHIAGKEKNKEWMGVEKERAGERRFAALN